MARSHNLQKSPTDYDGALLFSLPRPRPRPTKNKPLNRHYYDKRLKYLMSGK